MLVAWTPTLLVLLFFLFLAWMQSDAGDPSGGASDNEDNDTNGSNSRKASLVGRYHRHLCIHSSIHFPWVDSLSV